MGVVSRIARISALDFLFCVLNPDSLIGWAIYLRQSIPPVGAAAWRPEPDPGFDNIGGIKIEVVTTKR
jgi:hypothetical protein